MLPGAFVPCRVIRDLTLIKSAYGRHSSDLHQATMARGFDDQGRHNHRRVRPEVCNGSVSTATRAAY